MIQIRHPKLEEIARSYAEVLSKIFISKGKITHKQEDCFRELIACSAENLSLFIEPPQIKGVIDADAYSNYTGSQNRYDLDGKKQRLGYWLVNQLGITVCPYCNHNYIFTRDPENEKGRADLDHYYPKSKISHLALSFYNLIPCCKTCNSNGIKGDQTIDINPYEGGFENSHLFTVVNLVEFFLTQEQETEVKLVKNESYAKEPSLDPTENIRVFRLNELYSQHGTLVRDLMTKAEAYHEGYYESLRESFKGVGIGSNKDLDRLIFGNYVAPEDFGKQPLSKFTRDILLQLGVDLS